MELGDADLSEILRLIDESAVAELRVEVAGLSLYVRKGAGGAPARAAAVTAPTQANAASETSAPAATSDPAVATTPVKAPMMGTFYRSQAPGEPPLANVGDRVEPNTVVCLIEVMKLMNHIEAGVSGTIVEVLAENGALVDFDAPLFAVAAEQ